MQASTETVDVLKFEKKINESATLFRIQEIDDAYASEVILLRGTSVISLRVQSYRDKFLMAEERLIHIVSHIKGNDERNVAEGTGFCLGSVILSGNYAHEFGSFLFQDELGTHISIDIDTYKPNEGITLLDRMSGPDSLLSKYSVQHSVLRKGERRVAGMRAQEWLGWADLSEGAEPKAFKFALETMRSSPGRGSPSISLTLDTAQPLSDGSKAKTAMSDEQAIRLWDSIVESVQVVNPE